MNLEGDIQTDMEAVLERKQRVLEGVRDGAYSNVEHTENLDFVEGRGSFE